MINVKEFKSLADELMNENSFGTAFTNAIPPDWPTEAWMYILQIKSEIWDDDSLQYWMVGHTYAPEAVVHVFSKSTYSRVRNRIASKRNLPKEIFWSWQGIQKKASEPASPQTKKHR